MHHRLRARWGAAMAAALTMIAVPLMLAQGASAETVPPGGFTCGVTVFADCNQTAHFSTPSGTAAPEVALPSPQATGCPAWVAVDALEIQGTGNGVEHNIFRDPGDGTQTETFTGTVTITAYTADSAGNPGAPDASVLPYTGHLTEWFGATFKNMNPIVDHATVNFSGTAADGSTFSIHLVTHINVPTASVAPLNFFAIGQC